MVVFSRICLFVGAVTLVGLHSFTANGDEIVSSSITSKSFDSVYSDDNQHQEGVRRLGGYYSVYNDYDKYYGYGGKGSSGSSDSDSSGSKRGSDSSSGGGKGGSSSGSGSKSSSSGSGSKSGSSSDSNNKGYYGKMNKYNKYGKGGYDDNSDSSSSGRKGIGSGSDSSSDKGGSGSSSSGSKSQSRSDSSSSDGRRRKDDPKDDDNDKNDNDERFALRINCGGLGTDDYCEDYRYFNVNGDLWFHDCEYQDDYDAEIFSVDTIYDIDEYGNEIEADDQEIYQSERFIREKDLVYNFDVNNGRYFIKLYFAENFFSTRKERVFDIAVQGEILEYDFDIYERVGKNFALILQFNDIYVDNYKLTIEFIKNIQDPKVNGIEIFQVE